MMLRAVVVAGRFAPLQRVQIEQLACCEPLGIGLHMTHWSMPSLAQVALQRAILAQLAHSTVALILKQADLPPHRYRYWKTATLNVDFVERASQVLWCYEQVHALASKGQWVVCFDQKPNLQALERCRPKQPMRRGQIERQEFEYILSMCGTAPSTSRRRCWFIVVPCAVGAWTRTTTNIWCQYGKRCWMNAAQPARST
jgi:hypothetical protein